VKRWKLAGTVYHEAIFQGQLTAAGSNAARLTEKMATSSNYIGRQGTMIQILGSFYLFSVAVLALISFLELRSIGAADPDAVWTLLVASGSVALQLFIQAGYLIMLTILATAEILAPDLYRWFESLPLSGVDVGTLKILALAREFLLPIAVIVLSTPLVAGFAGGTVAGGLVGLLVSLLHAVVILALVVLASSRMRRILRSADSDDRGARTARIVTMLVYGVGTLLVVFIMQIGSNVLARLFENPVLDAATSARALRLMALLPLPTAPSVLLVTLAVATGGGPAIVSVAFAPWMPVVGTLLYASLAALLGWRAMRVLRGESAHAGRSDATAYTGAARGSGAGAADAGHVASPPVAGVADVLRERPLIVRRPRRAFARQIARAMTRDTQVLITIVFPVVLPVLAGIGPLLSGSDIATSATMGLIVAGIGGGWMMIQGLTRLQFGSGGLEASLPVRERDRVFPRLVLSSILPAAGAALIVVVVRSLGPGTPSGAIAEAVAIAVVGPAGMLVKVVLFGRVGRGADPIVVDEIRTSARFWKWVAVVATLATMTGVVIGGHRLLVGYAGTVAHLILLAGVAGVGILEIWVSRRLFR